MTRTLWKRITFVVRYIAGPCGVRDTYDDARIVLVYFWAVLHDRPISWACSRENWPIWDQRGTLPWPSTMTRRLRRESVRVLLDECESVLRDLLGGDDTVFAIDGKPLLVSNCSSDPDARYGRAVSGKGKGYKLHAIVGESGAFWHWRLYPINVDERVVAREFRRDLLIHDVLLADKNYDANRLFEAMGKAGVQLLAPRRYGRELLVRPNRTSIYRIRSIEALELSEDDGARELHSRRNFIERVFGNLVSASYGLGHLPAWVRRTHRVRRWVQAKLILFMLARVDLDMA